MPLQWFPLLFLIMLALQVMELIASVTDLRIILKYFWKSLMGEITINSEVTKKHKAIARDIGDIAEYISNFRKYLALVHAFGGWGKTSAVQGGRLKDRTPETICKDGIRIFVMLYCGDVQKSVQWKTMFLPLQWS